MALAILFWTVPTVAHVERLKQTGVKVWMQIGRVVEAEQAVALGAGELIVQAPRPAVTMGPKRQR